MSWPWVWNCWMAAVSMSGTLPSPPVGREVDRRVWCAAPGALDGAVLHEGLGGNIASDRSFRYGDPERAFAEAAHRISIDIRYPRNSCTPIETYGVIADYDASEDAFDILANFQGPFSIHTVIARAFPHETQDFGFGARRMSATGVLDRILAEKAKQTPAGRQQPWFRSDGFGRARACMDGQRADHRRRRQEGPRGGGPALQEAQAEVRAAPRRRRRGSAARRRSPGRHRTR